MSIRQIEFLLRLETEKKKREAYWNTISARVAQHATDQSFKKFLKNLE